jgi:mRNA interferase MazF
MAVTSQAWPENRFDIPLQHWQPAGLIKPSMVKPVTTTIERGLVIKETRAAYGDGLAGAG